MIDAFTAGLSRIGRTLVTRNVADFATTHVPLVDPGCDRRAALPARRWRVSFLE